MIGRVMVMVFLGVLFGSVTQTNLADAIWERLKVRVDRRKIGQRLGQAEIRFDVKAGETAKDRPRDGDPARPHTGRIGRYQVPIEFD